jgi:hypothetical protein
MKWDCGVMATIAIQINFIIASAFSLKEQQFPRAAKPNCFISVGIMLQEGKSGGIATIVGTFVGSTLIASKTVMKQLWKCACVAATISNCLQSVSLACG